MATLIVLFNLQSDADVSAYEDWAKNSDLKTVRALSSCDSFEIYRTSGLFGKNVPAPYEYVEVIQIGDLGTFGQEVQTETMAAVAAQFRSFADNPIFMLSENIES